MKLKENRNIFVYIFLAILTCGFYSYYFIYAMALDANTLCSGDGKKTPGLIKFLLLSVLTCGIYSIYWEYSLGNRLAENGPRYGLQFQENGSSVLMWRIFGMALCGFGAFVAMNILIKNMNAMAHVYNEGVSSGYDASGASYAQEPSYAAQPSLSASDDDMLTMPVQEWKPDSDMAQTGGCIECCRGVYEGAQFPFEGELVIGRDETCAHIVIKSPEISRRHCSIFYNRENGSYTVTDDSSNGVFYKNGQAFPKNQPVSCGAGTILVIANSGNEFLLK